MSETASSSSLLSFLFHGPRRSSVIAPYPSPDPLLRDFENRLSSQMENLLQEASHQQQHCSCFSAKWLRRALDVSLSAHSEAEKLLSSETEGRNCDPSLLDFVNQQLEDTVKLLDVCSAARERIWEMKRYRVSLQLAIHCLDGDQYNFISAAQLVRARNALSRCVGEIANMENDPNVQRSKLEECGSTLRQMGEFKHSGNSRKGINNNNNNNTVEAIMYGCKATTVFTCAALVAAFSFKSMKSMGPVSNPSRSTWRSSLATVHQKVKEEVDCKRRTNGGRAVLQELDSVDTAVRNLYDVVNRLIACKPCPPGNWAVQVKQSVHILKMCTAELEEGVDILEKRIGQMRNVLVNSRMAQLDFLTYANLSEVLRSQSYIGFPLQKCG